jgi:hypothetical protein
MKPVAGRIVGDLADWELPSLERKLDNLVEVLQQRKIRIALDVDSLGEQLYAQLYDEVRVVGATAANEAITGWLQGLADGCPELCTQFPFLTGDDKDAKPLTVLYTVGARDGSRAEINRTDLAQALEEAAASGQVPRTQVRALAARLRLLADELDGCTCSNGANAHAK